MSVLTALDTNTPAHVVRSIQKVTGTLPAPLTDSLAIEEPLAIRLECDAASQRVRKVLSVTMRTPGHDAELALGFLFTEGILRALADVAEVTPTGNVVEVELRRGVSVDVDRLERHFYTSSSCGVCGKTSIAAVQVGQRYPLPIDSPVFDAAVIHQLPERLRGAQAGFDRTGGLHAAALFDTSGHLLCLREDVGRHNAVDKLIGAQLLAGVVPLRDRLLLVSGRASFELVQKALLAAIPVLAAVGAPSSLAVDLARDRGMTILGFVRNGRFNVYSGAGRVRLGDGDGLHPDTEGVTDVQPSPVPPA